MRDNYSHENTPEGFEPCTREKGHEGPCALALKPKTPSRILIELINIYYNNENRRWWQIWRRDRAIKQYLDILWDEIGPKEETDDL